jgi:hypothetical protein
MLGLLIVPVSLAVFATERRQASAEEPAAGDDGVEAVSLAVPRPR